VNCQHFTDFIIDWLDGELPADQAEVFAAHIEMCPPCEQYLDQYRTTVELTKDCAPAEDVPSEVPEALIRAILAARPEIDEPDGGAS